MKPSDSIPRHVIPIFPLACVVFPGEELQLHIFEDRFKAMVNECLPRPGGVAAKPFGIACVFEDNPAKIGCTVIVEEVMELYEDGRMDIKTRGVKRFEVHDIIRDRIYPQAAVSYFEDEAGAEAGTNTAQLAQQTHDMQEHLLKLVHSEERTLPLAGSPHFSFCLAHHAGLALEQRQAFLEMRCEKERLDFLVEHYNRVIPMIEEEEEVKRLIRMNGHLRALKAADI